MRSWILVALVLAKCGGPPPPLPPPPVANVACIITDLELHTPISGAQCLIASVSGLTNEDGYVVLNNVTTGRQTVQVTDSEYDTYEGEYLFGPGNVNLPVSLTAKEFPLPRLSVDGQFFRQDPDTRFVLIGTSDFQLYGRFLAGEDIRPVLEQRQEIGFNTLRVFTQYDITLSNGERLILLNPQYEKLLSFLRLAASYGFYVELTAYTGPYTWGFSTDHWTKLCAAVQGRTNVLLSLVNENSQTNNHLDPAPFQPCPGVLSSRGTDVVPATGWNWTELHSNGQFEWWRKVGHNTMELADIFHVPASANENQRYPDQEQSLSRAFGAAQGCALLAAGCFYHSIRGRTSRLFDGLELEAAVEWVKGIRSIPLWCQTRNYVHRIDLEGSMYLRVYQRGTDDQCIAWIGF